MIEQSQYEIDEIIIGDEKWEDRDLSLNNVTRDNNTAIENNTSFTRDLFESDYPGLENLSPPIQATLVTLYTITALLALFGNVTVIIVLTTGKRSSRELRVFLVNLAVSDITMAVFSIPFTYTDFMLGRWIFHPNFCPVVQFMQHCSVMVSVYTLTAIGVDRYYAIMHPLNSRWTKYRGTLIIVLIWCMSLGVSSIQLVHGKAVPFNWAGKEYYDCTEEWDEFGGKVYTLSVFVLTFALPMTVLTFSYSSVGWKMWRHTSPGNADAVRDQQQLLAKIKVVKMLATVVCLFAVCWLPIHIFNLLIYFHRDLAAAEDDFELYLYTAAFFFCHWLSMANSFINPIIYCFMSDNFRVDLKQLVYCCCRARKPKIRGHLTLLGRSSYGSSFMRTTITTTNTSAFNHVSFKRTNQCHACEQNTFGLPLRLVSNNRSSSPQTPPGLD